MGGHPPYPPFHLLFYLCFIYTRDRSESADSVVIEYLNLEINNILLFQCLASAFVTIPYK